MVSCVIRYPQCINYSEPYRTECANERETFDLDKIIGYIVKNLSVKKSEQKNIGSEEFFNQKVEALGIIIIINRRPKGRACKMEN